MTRTSSQNLVGILKLGHTLRITKHPVSPVVSSSPIPARLPFYSSTAPGTRTRRDTTVEGLAITFGTIIGILLLAIVLYLVLRRMYAKRRAQEHAFRQGLRAASVGGPPPDATPPSRSHTPSRWLAPAIQHNHSLSQSSRSATTIAVEPYTHSKAGSSSVLSSKQSASVASGAPNDTTATASSSTYTQSPVLSTRPLAFLSSAPASFQIPGLGRGHKGDANSLMTDFLQV